MSVRKYVCQYVGNNLKICDKPERDVASVSFGGIEYLPERTCRKVPGKMKYGRRMPACSECGYSLGDKRWNFCPNCGAKMVEQRE